MSITQQLQAILQARYGRDVRQAIHDSISDLNEIANTAQTSAKAYYEGTQALAQKVSGNVGIDDSTATLSTTYSSHKIENKTRTNRLNPTLDIKNAYQGVTITNNGDGTYTLTGKNTGSGTIWFNFFEVGARPTIESLELKVGTTYRYTCIPINAGSGITFWSNVTTYNGTTKIESFDDFGSGSRKITIGADVTNMHFGINILAGVEFPSDGLVIKPMLTTDLSATYDDFVQYSGNSELNANVAKLYKEIQTLKNAITELGGTV